MTSEYTSTPEEAALVSELLPLFNKNSAVTVRLKSGAEYAGRISDVNVAGRVSPWDPEAWVYAGDVILITPSDVEVPFDVLDIAAVTDTPELDEEMAALWKSRDYPERPR